MPDCGSVALFGRSTLVHTLSTYKILEQSDRMQIIQFELQRRRVPIDTNMSSQLTDNNEVFLVFREPCRAFSE